MLSPAQKGVRPSDGVFEHNYKVETLIANAKLQHRDLSLAFLDLANAFGSISHSALFSAIQAAGTNATFVEVVRDLYSGCSSSLITDEGISDPIPLSRGVRQGCPLSPFLFNLKIDPVLRAALSLSDHQVQGGAYADDLWLEASAPETIQ